ncbi:MAG: site-specific DNA-methyltransferase [Candidatus Syntrophonatronum acetioxidans]|uniref:Methyltransferase n=1 Tax=Candidatus Syntrophonatronum acetioxidans TaxID=1795816 RepID=A0A424YGQ7_9FIRM|nr:MAG: site-specific DNA-methyltransferase [Candidatus Syntrophonatronum acetioxidans]
MRTSHNILFQDSRELKNIKDEGADLAVTSPPYPMIEMWDEMFIKQNPEIEKAFKEGESSKAFEYMHRELDKVWRELFRVLKKGGIACINIGDATRTIKGNFKLYSNHSRIINNCLSLGFSVLPNILWRKQTNAPNKFMGSGMLPPGAYVTLEHEYIIILRKGSKREFKTPAEKANRKESAFFWEERNRWFSDIWEDLRGTRQKLDDEKARKRSGAFPFELAYRLINMFSVKGDMVLDPFLGTGTTMLAAMASQRNSTGLELDTSLEGVIKNLAGNIVDFSNLYIRDRMEKHLEFIEERNKNNKPLRHYNHHHNIPVTTRQETCLKLHEIEGVQERSPLNYVASYKELTPPKVQLSLF